MWKFLRNWGSCFGVPYVSLVWGILWFWIHTRCPRFLETPMLVLHHRLYTKATQGTVMKRSLNTLVGVNLYLRFSCRSKIPSGALVGTFIIVSFCQDFTKTQILIGTLMGPQHRYRREPYIHVDAANRTWREAKKGHHHEL